MGDALDMVAVAMVKRKRGRRVVGDVAGMAMARPCLVVSRGCQGMGWVGLGLVVIARSSSEQVVAWFNHISKIGDLPNVSKSHLGMLLSLDP
jgi:hypothetical protein